jgi:hypothetical protein
MGALSSIFERSEVADKRATPLSRRSQPAGMAVAFAFLIVTAIVLYYAKWPVLIIAALIGFFRGLFWQCERYPRTMLVILAIVRGMIGGRRAPKNRNFFGASEPRFDAGNFCLFVAQRSPTKGRGRP